MAVSSLCSSTLNVLMELCVMGSHDIVPWKAGNNRQITLTSAFI